MEEFDFSGYSDEAVSSARPPSDEFDFSGYKDESVAKPKKGTLGQFGSALAEGFTTMAGNVGAAFDAVTGDNQGVVDSAKAQKANKANTGAAEMAAFERDLGIRSQNVDTGFVQSAKNVGGAIMDNKVGAAQMLVNQVPNALPAVGGGLAMAKVGAMAGTAVGGPLVGIIGGVVGGIAGMYLGNSSIEIGAKANEKASDGALTDDERASAVKEGAIKSAFVTGADVASLGASRYILGAATRAADRAAMNTLRGAGVDVADQAAVAAALKNPAVSTAVKAAATKSAEEAAKAASTVGKKAGRGAAVVTTEGLGEGGGELSGEYAATGKLDYEDAILEAVMGVGQSTVEIPASYAWSKMVKPGEGGTAVQPPAADVPKMSTDFITRAFTEVGGAGQTVDELRQARGLVAASLSQMDDQEAAQAVSAISGGNEQLAQQLLAARQDQGLIQLGRDTDGDSIESFMAVNHMIRSDAGLVQQDEGDQEAVTQYLSQRFPTVYAQESQAPQAPIAPAQGMPALPESAGQLQAQVQAVREGRKPVVFVGEQEAQTLDVRGVAQGTIQGPDGNNLYVFAPSDEAVNAVVTRAAEVGASQAMGEALGYAQPGLTEGEPTPTAAVQQIDNATGQVIQEEIVTPEAAGGVNQIPGTSMRVAPPGQVLAERGMDPMAQQMSQPAVNTAVSAQSTAVESTPSTPVPDIGAQVLPQPASTAVPDKSTAVKKPSAVSELVQRLNASNRLEGGAEINEASIVEVKPSSIKDKGEQRRMRQLKQAAKTAFGVDLIIVDTPSGSLMRKDGSKFNTFIGVADQEGKRLFLNRASANPMNTMAHELVHLMETQFPEAYAKLEDVVLSRVRYGAFRRLKAGLEAAIEAESKGSADAQRLMAEVRSEIVAEAVGQMGQSQQLWADVFAGLQDQTQAKKFYDAVIELLGKLAKAFTREGYIEGLKDMQAVRKAVTEAFVQWSVKEQAATPKATKEDSAPQAVKFSRLDAQGELIKRITEGEEVSMREIAVDPEVHRVYVALEARRREAETLKPGFDAIVTRISEKLGTKPMLASVKGMKRAFQKVWFDYDHDATKIKDLVRATVVFSNLADVDKAIAEVQAEFPGATVKRNGWARNGSGDPSTGYRDVFFNVSYQGTVVELQANHPELLKEKDRRHIDYEFTASVDKERPEDTPIYDKYDGSWISDNRLRVSYKEALARQRVAYTAAYFRALDAEDFARDRNSSLEIGAKPSETGNEALTNRGPLGSNAKQPNSVQQTATPSQSQKAIASSAADSGVGTLSSDSTDISVGNTRTEYSTPVLMSRADLDRAVRGEKISPQAMVDTTPASLVKHGLRAGLPIAIEGSIIKKILTGKLNIEGEPQRPPLTVAQLMELGELISDPAAVFESASRDDSIVVMTKMLDSAGDPVIVAIQKDNTRGYDTINPFNGQQRRQFLTANFVNSAYGKSNIEGLEAWLKSGRMLDWDKRQTENANKFPPKVHMLLLKYRNQRGIVIEARKRGQAVAAPGRDTGPIPVAVRQAPQRPDNVSVSVGDVGVNQSTGRKIIGVKKALAQRENLVRLNYVGDYKNSGVWTFTNPPPKPAGKVLSEMIGAAFDRLAGVRKDWKLQDSQSRAVEMGVAEIETMLREPKSGLDWYEEDIKKAFDTTTTVIPSLAREQKRRLFAVMAAIMSPQTNARDNWNIAAKGFQHYESTGTIPGMNPETGGFWQGGTTSVNKAKQLNMLDAMVKDIGEEAAVEWIHSEHTVKELNEARRKWGGMGPGVAGKMTDTDLGFYAFGPKVGPFAMNLNGIHEVTVDMWMTRTFNRWMGAMLDDSGKMIDAPTEPQRRVIKDVVNQIADRAGIKPYQVQSVLWFFEQGLFKRLGSPVESYGFSDGAAKFTGRDAASSDAGKLDGGEAVRGGNEEAGRDPAGKGRVLASRSPPDDFTDDMLTDTPAFKAWFGDSKVVDSAGKPLVVYHAGDFNESYNAVPMISGQGFHFGTRAAAEERKVGKAFEEEVATPDVYEDGGRYYIDEEWPTAPANGFKTEADARTWIAGEVLQYQNAEDIPDLNVTEAYLRLSNPLRMKDQFNDWSAAVIKAKAAGHDGIIYRNEVEDRGSTSYIVFKPTQIKSSTGNSGDFDGTNPDIRFSRSLAEDLDAQSKWLDSKAKEAGYKDIDALAEGDYDKFIELAQEWRQENPAEVLFARPLKVMSAQAVMDMARTGKMPYNLDDAIARGQVLDAYTLAKNQSQRSQLLGKLGDWAIETFADSMISVRRWIDRLPLSATLKQRMTGDLYRAATLRSAMQKEVKDRFTDPMFREMERAAKATKLTSDQVKVLSGYWMTAKYAPKANAFLLAKDTTAMQLAIQTGDPALIAQAQQNLNDRAADITGVVGAARKRGVAGGFNDAEAAQTMREIEAKIPRQLLDDISKHMYDMLAWKKAKDLQSGRISQAMVNSWPNHRDYVPLTGDPRFNADSEDVFTAGGQLNQDKDKAINGRKESISDDAIDAAYEATVKSINFAGIQDFKRSLAKAYEEAQAAGVDIGVKREPVTGIIRTGDDVVIYRDTYVAPNGLTTTRASAYRFNDNKVIQALKRENEEQLNRFLSAVATPTRWYGKLVTQFMPMFAPINFIRDMWERSELVRTRKLYDSNGNLINTDKIARAAILESMSPRLWKGSLASNFNRQAQSQERADLEELIKLGGSSVWGDYLARNSAALEGELRASFGKVAGTLRVTNNFVENYNNTFEMIAPLSIFRALKAEGMTAKDAAAATLDLMNFKKRGVAMPAIRALYVFAQPAATSGYNLAQYLSTKKGQKRFVGQLLIGTALYAFLKGLWGDDEEDELGNKLDNLSNFTVERTIPIPIGDMVFKIPVGFGAPQLAWMSGGVFNRWLSGRYDTPAAAGELFKGWIKSVSPVAPSEMEISENLAAWALMSFTPTVVKPLAAIGMEKTVFGQQLLPAFIDPEKFKSEQAKRTTPQIYKDIATEIRETIGVDIYPDNIKALADGWLIGPARELTSFFIENPAKAIRGEPGKVVGISSILDNVNDRQLLNSVYYRTKSDAEDTNREYEARSQDGTLMDWITPEKMAQVSAYKRMEKVERQMGSLRGQLTKQAQFMDPETLASRTQQIEEQVDQARRGLLKEMVR